MLFVAGFGPIVRDDQSRRLYGDVLKLPLKEEHGYGAVFTPWMREGK